MGNVTVYFKRLAGCLLFFLKKKNSHSCRNVMSSQEAVDFVRVRLSEQLANGTLDLAKICENVRACV